MANELSKIKRILHPKKGEDDGAVARRIRMNIEQIIEGNQHLIQEYMQMIAEEDPKSFIQIWMQLLEYTTPKISRQEIKQEDTNDIIVVGGDAIEQRIKALEKAKTEQKKIEDNNLKDEENDQ